MFLSILIHLLIILLFSIKILLEVNMNPYEKYARLELILSLKERIEKLEEQFEARRTIDIDISDWKNCEPWELGGC